MSLGPWVGAYVMHFRALSRNVRLSYVFFSAFLCLRRLVRISCCVSKVWGCLRLALAAFMSSLCVPIASLSTFFVSLRLAISSVLVIFRISAPGVVVLLMLFSNYIAAGSTRSVGVVGDFFFSAVG